MNKGVNFIDRFNIYDKSILDKIDYNIICLSHRPDLSSRAIEKISHLNVNIVTKLSRCFSEILNSSIFESAHEFNIILNHKMQPEEMHIVKILNLLSLGYGMAAVGSFHLFGFSKELFRIIGHWDERFTPGEYEDCDFLIRIHEANIAWFLSKELKDHQNIGSGFGGSDLPRQWFRKKWGLENSHDLSKYTRFEQEQVKYNFGSKKSLKFLDHSFTIDYASPGYKNI